MLKPVAVRTAILSGLIVLAAAPFNAAAPAAGTSSAGVTRDRTVTIPTGTVLRLRVSRGFGSDISRVEDQVPATLARALVIGGRTVIPAGSRASGYVSEATRPGKIKGRGRVAVRFTRIAPADGSDWYPLRTNPWVAVAPAPRRRTR